MRVCVVGLGYVGLVTAACAADWGHDVVGVDADPVRVGAIRAGRVPFHEPELDRLVQTGIESGSLRVTADTRSAVAAADLTIVAVGTHDGNGGWQTATLLGCLAQVVPDLAAGAVLVVRSTLPLELIPRLGDIVASLRRTANRGPIPVVLNPEFTREGSAVADFQHPDRIVFGVADDATGRGTELLRRFYRRAEARVLVMDATDAALAKLGSNLFLATKISFANELAALCDAYGGRVEEVVEAMALDPRIGGGFLRAGVGFGGSCLPHQVTMTVRDAEAAGVPTPLLAAVDETNHRQRERFVERLERLLAGLAGRRIALLGLTFKPDTDDLRDAPSLEVAGRLLAGGAEVVAYDPMPAARAVAARLVAGLQVVDTVAEALSGADAAGLVTEWPEFRSIDWREAGRLMRDRVVVDGRNALPVAEIAAAGFRYSAFGRPELDAVPALTVAPTRTESRVEPSRTPGQPERRPIGPDIVPAYGRGE